MNGKFTSTLRLSSSSMLQVFFLLFPPIFLNIFDQRCKSISFHFISSFQRFEKICSPCICQHTLAEHLGKIRSIPLSTSRPTFEEVSRVWKDLTEIIVGKIQRKSDIEVVSAVDDEKMREKESEDKGKEEERCVLADRAPPRIVYPKPRERRDPSASIPPR